jgi:linoleoyl-CoA desaturase
VLFYGLMTLFWALHKDVIQLIRYEKMGLVKRAGSTYRAQLVELALTKVLYYVYLLVIPMMITDLTLGQWAVGFLTLHFVAGVILALVFQAAHVLEETAFPLPDDNKRIENEWAIHQLKTTADYARGSMAVTWYCGGLNYQIEHHLFPTICHIHYPKLAAIVEETAREYSLPYHQHKTFLGALTSHFRFLKILGQPTPVQA